MKIRHAVHPDDFRKYDTKKIRKEFHSSGLMKKNKIRLTYTHYDRFIFGGAYPVDETLLLTTYDELKSDFFLERREIGIINIGGTGEITVDGETYNLSNLEALYIGKGKQKISFSSIDSNNPAKFYINSTPAHHAYPTVKAGKKDANVVNLGSQDTANERVIYQYIHEDGIQSCQLVMGYTELKRGNIWNTFPPHTHERRMEVYFYFDLPDDNIVVHFLGQPQETRHLTIKNEEAAISPPWSIHSGAGTSHYKFIWGMGGENKAFTDMDGVSLGDVL